MPTMLSADVRRALFCAVLISVAMPAFAQHASEPAQPSAFGPPQVTREVCTSIAWGFGGSRNDCRYETLPVAEGQPGPHGICVIAYGIRTCR